MPSGLVAALAAPIRELQSLVGPGWSNEATSALSSAREALVDMSAATRRSWTAAEASWFGGGADAASQFTAATVARAQALAERVGRLDAAARAAGVAVSRAKERLQAILERFEARAAALEPHLESPIVERELLAEAQRSLDEAVAVIDELRAELDGHAGALTTPTSRNTPAATTPAGLTGAAMPSMGSGLGGGAPMSPPSGIDRPPRLDGLGDLAKFAAHDAPQPDAASFGNGFAVRLPDGSTATAPNAVAASAVRHALTQLGVPYQWGGTTPGVGLDCSGLTQWAYHEAGLNIPRLAQEQDVGAAVNPGSLRPGDLAVWDGHVAMIVGNGTMIEAGDPVKLSPIRTTNLGQGFQGFWRPTA